MRQFFWGIILTLVGLALGGLFISWKGYLDFRADQKPSVIETKLAMGAVDASTQRHAPPAANPLEPTEANLRAGAVTYRENCAVCHGDPATPETVLGRNFYPPVPQFMKDAPDMPENENYYIIQHGIRWSGMPGWKDTLSDNQIRQLVTLLSRIQKVPPAVEQELRKSAPGKP